MTQWNAPALLEATSAYWQGCAIMAAVRLNLFQHLHAEPDIPVGLARRLDSDPRALAMLLRALAALGLLDRDGDCYRCSTAATKLLVPDSPEYLGDIILHQHHLLESWTHLDRAVRSGCPQRQRSSFSDPEWRESFLLGMQNLANLVAPQLLPRIDIGPRTRMLDLGGGPGAWAIQFCRRHPNLTATVFDLPGSQPFAERAIRQAGLESRIDFQSGDFHRAPLPQGMELIWMSHVLHGEGPASCQALIGRAAASLAEGGLLLIHEFILDDTGPGPLYPALFALNMLLGTADGTAYSEGELRRMLNMAGLGRIERLALPAHSRSGILLAHKERT